MISQSPRPYGLTLRTVCTRCTRFFTLFYTLGVSVLILTAPAMAQAIHPANGSGGSNEAPGAVGQYLAGRHAEQVGQSLTALQYYGAAARENDLSTASLQKRIYILALTEGRIDEALIALNKIESAGAQAPFANLVRAVQALKLNDFARVDDILKTETKGLMRLLSPVLKAWAKAGQNDRPGALKALAVLKEKAAPGPLHNLHAALIEDALGDPDKAEQYFLSVIAQAGMSTRITQLLGAHYERLGQYDKAEKLYTALAAKGEGAAMLALSQARRNATPPVRQETFRAQDGAAEALYNIASVLQAQSGDNRVQVLAYLSLYLRPNAEPTQIVVAAALDFKKRYRDANALYAKIAPGSALSWGARMNMASNLDRIGQTDDALKMLAALAKERPDSETPLTQMGDILRRHDRFKEATVAYTQALARIKTIGVRHWTIFYARGIAYEQTQRWPLAEADFLKALELSPQQPLTLNYLGYSWVDQGINLDRALDMIAKAVQLRPRDGYIVDSLGWGLYRMGQFEDAVKKLERAVMLRPADPVINDHLGDALWQVGRTREARFQWERAKNLNPDDALKKSLDNKLKNGLDAAVAL